jgi:hypothetical protein
MYACTSLPRGAQPPLSSIAPSSSSISPSAPSCSGTVRALCPYSPGLPRSSPAATAAALSAPPPQRAVQGIAVHVSDASGVAEQDERHCP